MVAEQPMTTMLAILKQAIRQIITQQFAEKAS